MASARIIIAAAISLAALAPRPAHACSGEAESSLALDGVYPRTGTTAPRNTSIWVSPLVGAVPLDASDVVVTEDGVVLATTPTPITISGESDRLEWVFTPSVPLTIGAAVEVKIRGMLASQFVIGADADEAPPAGPEILRVDVTGEYFGEESCGSPSRVKITIGGDDSLLLVTAAPLSTLPSSALALATGSTVTAIALSEGEHSLYLTAVDLAANASTSVPVPRLTVPAEQTGCQTSSGQAPGACAAIALALALCRRRGRKRQRQRA